MRSSSDKRRDMARSILPSKTRAPGQLITGVKRARRRDIARELFVANGVPADWDDQLDGVDLRAYPDHEISGYVRWRRGADKLNHFERWAVRATRHLPPEDRLGVLRAQLPRGLVGDHAMSHLRRLPELRPPGADPGSWAARVARFEAERGARAERAARAAERRRAAVVALLEAADGHRSLNRAMKAAPHGDPPRWRTLAGRHDVDAFLADVAATPTWSAALARFLGEPVTPAR